MGIFPADLAAMHKDGKWKIGGKRQMVYAKRELTIRDRIAAAKRLLWLWLRLWRLDPNDTVNLL